MRNSLLLSPEYRNAMNVIDNAIVRKCFTTITDDLPKEIVRQGSISVVKNDFTSKNIPSGPNWGWNQVKSRKKLQLPKSNVLVEFYKLMPRRKTRDIQLVPLKIWRFDVFDSKEQKKKFTIVWCEKGIIQNETTILLENLQFLAQFIQPDVAKEIWPSLNKGFDNCEIR